MVKHCALQVDQTIIANVGCPVFPSSIAVPSHNEPFNCTAADAAGSMGLPLSRRQYTLAARQLIKGYETVNPHTVKGVYN